MTVLGEGAARVWLRIILIADVILAVLAWLFVIGFMHAPFWTPEPQHHPWGDYAQATVIVLGGALAATEVLVVAARLLVGRGLRLVGVLVAAVPFEALFWLLASNGAL